MEPRKTVLSHSVDLATRKPRQVIAVWLAAIVVMGIASIGAKEVLHAEDLVISGTQSAEAIKLDRQQFGASTPLMVALQGPPRQLDAIGPRLVRSIDEINGVAVGSPWSPGAPLMLREEPGRALLIVSLDGKVVDAGNDRLPLVQQRLNQLPPTIEARVAGESRFSTELVDLVLAGAQKAELVALPFLLLILLLIFRSPVAAGLPLVQGLVVIIVTSGFVTTLGRVFDVNVLAQASGSIIGLALGVDYSLLFVSRFRDELRAGRSVDDAVAVSLATAGRTVAFAGGILALAGVFVIVVTFGWASMTTGSIGVIAAALFSVLAAYTLLPACLKLLGENVNRWPIGRTNPDSRLAPWVSRMIRRPAVASAVVLLPLLLLCGAAMGMDTGGPDLKNFRSDNPMRSDMETVAGRYGGGVMSPYEVVVKSPSGPITSPANVRYIQRFQRQVAADPSVKYVVGVGTGRVRTVSDSGERGAKQVSKFAYGLAAASTGVRDVRKGIGKASGGADAIAGANNAALAGAQQLQAGARAAAAGAGSLTSGLGKSVSGSRKLDSALNRLSAGANKLRSATRTGASDARAFAGNANTLKGLIASANATLGQVKMPSNGGAVSDIDAAIAALDGLPPAVQSEPGVQSARSSLVAAKGGISSGDSGPLDSAVQKFGAIESAVSLGAKQAADAATQVGKLSSGVGQLAGGIDQVAGNTGDLTAGLSKLSSGSGQLQRGLDPLAGGAQSLSNGIGQLSSGSGALGEGLSSGYKQSGKLESGVNRLRRGVEDARRASAGSTEGEPLDLKDVGKSAYLTMALLGAAPAAEKQNLRLVLNEEQGGSAARVYIITEKFPTDKSMGPFADRLDGYAAALADRTGATVAVGGQGQTFLDYDEFTHSRIWLLIAALSLMSFIFLLIVFRSPLLALKAVILNMITVGAAMGAISLLFGGDNPLLGGPGWMEATSFFVVYSTTFALSMDYEIFMINRMRESYLESGSNEVAISEGVTKTAGIVTGSAAVMSVLFIAMALTSDLISNAQMGLGLALAILIDATLVRLILLPASMRLFGDANWWLPGWLDRRLPRFDLHSPSEAPAAV